MRIIILLLCCIVSLLGLELTEQEQNYIKNNPVITASNENDYIPVNFNQNGTPKGYSVDFIRLAAKKAGLRVEFVSGKTFDTYLQMAREQKLDVVLNTVKTPKRQQYLLFGKPYLQLYPSIFTRSESKVGSLQELQGRVLAVPRGYYFTSYIQNHYPDIKILLAKNNLDALQAVQNGNADATIGLAYTMRRLMLLHMIDGVQIAATAKIAGALQSAEYLAVRKDLPVLHAILQKAQAAISPERIKRLKAKWLDLDGARSSMNGIYFSQLERGYLQEKEVLHMCVSPDWMPYEGITGGRHSGMNARFFDLIRQKMPIEIKLAATKNWTQTLQYARTRKCDFISMAMGSPKRRTYLDFTAPYLKAPLVLAARQDQFFIDSLAQLTGKKIGIKRNFAILELLEQKYPEIDFEPIETIRQGLEQVSKGKLFGVIDSLAVIGYTYQKEFLDSIKIAGKFDR